MRTPILHFRGALAAMLLAASVPAGAAERPAPAAEDEFFIVSSVDIAKSAMVLKRPTEVTLTMLVTDTTRGINEEGKPIRLSDLRAGDTVFISSSADASGHTLAKSLRKGPMTVPELHRRYLRFGPPGRSATGS